MWESDGRECLLGQMSDQACASFLQSKCFTLRGKSRTSTVLNSGDRLRARTLPQTRPGTKSHRHMSDIQEAVCQGERGQERPPGAVRDCQLQMSEGRKGWWHHSQVEYLRGASGKLGPSSKGFLQVFRLGRNHLDHR